MPYPALETPIGELIRCLQQLPLCVVIELSDFVNHI
jgi:hypothetical protein